MKKYVNIKEELFIEVEHDDFAESPREWDNLWDIYTWEDRRISPDKNPYPSFDHFLEDHFSERQVMNLDNHRRSARDHFEALQRYFARIGYLVAPVNRYEHGSVSYTVGTRTGWDQGVVGIALVSYDELKYQYISKTVTEEVKKRALKLLELELKEYTAWANGEVYIANLTTFDGECIDSISQIYGDTMEDVVKTYVDFSDRRFEDFRLMDIEERMHKTYEVAEVIQS